MTFLSAYLIGLLLIVLLMTLLWLWSLRIRNASIVDIFWGSGFVIVGWLYFVLADGVPARQWLMMLLVTIWGLRLTLHIGMRNSGKPEDFRYQRWRDEAGNSWWWRSFFKVFLLQGVVMWIVSMPVLAAQLPDTPPQLIWLDYIAIMVWIIGFLFESVGDWQLVQFKADDNNQGKVLNSGLWRYTRHPNYFGDAMQWWGFYLIALAAGAWWSIISPILMTYLLMRVSGVTMLESALKKRKPEYEAYMRNTSAFFPMPPKDD